RAGLDMLHVPYKGGTALVAAVLSGEVQSGWSGIPNVLAHIRAGKLKVYAISTARRSSTLPDVPTAAELGYPGFDIATVIGLQAPAGTPREVVGRLQTAGAEALRERGRAEGLAKLALEPRARRRRADGKPGDGAEGARHRGLRALRERGSGALQCRGEKRRRQA